MQLVPSPRSNAVPSRISPLAVLPVFLDLAGKRALVVGGSDAAAWKAELLAAAGATVTVVASGLGPDMARLAAAGLVERGSSDWTPALLEGYAVAVADLEDHAEAEAFASSARRQGVPCNVIDQPAFCSFQFGAIVNRSPVVVGISTAGAAPILGQAVRARIETLLPPGLAAWGALARRLRGHVAALAVPARRAVWEALATRAFVSAPREDDEAELSALLRSSAQQGGFVTFVGAGPGDPGMLTLDAVRALQAAEVILFDDLVSDAVLELARREARRILVGKRAGRPSCRQEEITDLMLTLARAGRRVVRLKSGDPMVFGRMGEETAALDAAGIPYAVVPGITAAQALGARMKASLTHRDYAKSLRLVTGHSKDGGLPEDLDWATLADPTATTVIYMGGRTAASLATRLMALGLPGDLPAVVGVSLGRAEEVLHSTSLSSLAGTVALAAEGEPVVIGLGQAFGKALTSEAVRRTRLEQGRAPF